MSHISVYTLSSSISMYDLLPPKPIDRLAPTGAQTQAQENIQQNAAQEAAARQRAEQLVLSELQRNFIELVERQEDALGNLRLLLKVNPKAVPGKTGDVEITIKTDNTLTIDVSNAPGQACKQLTQPLEMALGTPISVHYKPEYHDSKVRLSNPPGQIL